MCHNCRNNRKINRLHERCLLIIYNEKQLSFSELLEKGRSVSIHMKSIQFLAIEMFCVSENISLPIMNDILKQKDNSRTTLDKFLNFHNRW